MSEPNSCGLATPLHRAELQLAILDAVVNVVLQTAFAALFALLFPCDRDPFAVLDVNHWLFAVAINRAHKPIGQFMIENAFGVVDEMVTARFAGTMRLVLRSRIPHRGSVATRAPPSGFDHSDGLRLVLDRAARNGFGQLAQFAAVLAFQSLPSPSSGSGAPGRRRRGRRAGAATGRLVEQYAPQRRNPIR
jgi:hypothetical protein